MKIKDINLLLKPKLGSFLIVVIFGLLSFFTKNLSFLMVSLGVLIQFFWIVITVYFRKKDAFLTSMRVGPSYREGKLTKAVLSIIGDCIIQRDGNKNKFNKRVYNEANTLLLLTIRSKQYYPQIDCNAIYEDFGLVVVVNDNEKRDALLNWVKVNLPAFKYFFDEKSSEIVINVHSDYFFNGLNGPLISEVLNGYLGLDDNVNIKSNYFYD